MRYMDSAYNVWLATDIITFTFNVFVSFVCIWACDWLWNMGDHFSSNYRTKQKYDCLCWWMVAFTFLQILETVAWCLSITKLSENYTFVPYIIQLSTFCQFMTIIIMAYNEVYQAITKETVKDNKYVEMKGAVAPAPAQPQPNNIA